MSAFYIEHRDLRHATSLSWDIAHHMFTRYSLGSIIVITDRPTPFLSSVSKQWRKVIREVGRERSSTLQAHRILELNRENSIMQHLRMTDDPPHKLPDNDVFFVRPQEIAAHPPACQTMYIAIPVSDELFRTITLHMPRHSLVVRY